jgi:hypothetical protein
LIAIAVVLAGCIDESPDLRVRQVCDALCACASPAPAGLDRCVDECEADLAGTSFPDECIECTAEAACLAIDDCFDTCFTGVP